MHRSTLKRIESRAGLIRDLSLYFTLALSGALSQELIGDDQIYAQPLERHPSSYVGRWRATGLTVQLLDSGRFSIEQSEISEGNERGYWWLEIRGASGHRHLCLTASLEVICYRVSWVTSPSSHHKRPSMRLTLSPSSSIILHLELDSTPRASPNIGSH